MNFKEFKNMVRCGMEYNFYIMGNEYWISHNTEGYYLTKVADNTTQSFETVDELFNNALIEGKTIFSLWNDLQKFL